MKQRFSLHQHESGWFRLSAETAQKVTIVVCECETEQFASHMQTSLNAAPRAIQDQVISRAGVELLGKFAETA